MSSYIYIGALAFIALLAAPLMNGNSLVQSEDFLAFGWFIAGLVLASAVHTFERKPWRWRADTWTTYRGLVVGVRRWWQKVEVRNLNPGREGFDEALYTAVAEAKQQAVALNVAAGRKS